MTPAEPNSGSRAKQHIVLTVFVDFYAFDSVEVDNARTVNSAKLILRELSFQFEHAAAQQVGLLSDVQTGVVVGGFNPVNVGQFYEPDLACAL